MPHAQAAIENEASTARLAPRSVSAHTAMASSTKSASSAAAPWMPLCWPSTHTSHTTVASMGKARKRRSVSIHAPGRGRARAKAGSQLASR